MMPYDTASEWVSALKTGKAAFSVDMGFHPSAKWTELASTHPMKIIGWDDASLEKFKKALPFVFVERVPANVYKTMSYSFNVPAFGVVVEVTPDMPDDFVYEVTKMIWTHFDVFKTYHAAIKYLSPKSVDRNNFIYHPGAIKYYKEIGVWTSELDKRQADLLAKVRATR